MSVNSSSLTSLGDHHNTMGVPQAFLYFHLLVPTQTCSKQVTQAVLKMLLVSHCSDCVTHLKTLTFNRTGEMSISWDMRQELFIDLQYYHVRGSQKFCYGDMTAGHYGLPQGRRAH